MTLSEVQANGNYEEAFLGALLQSISNPAINISQIQNIQASDVIPGPALNVTYDLVVISLLPISAYSSQLIAAINSGAFNQFYQTRLNYLNAKGISFFMTFKEFFSSLSSLSISF